MSNDDTTTDVSTTVVVSGGGVMLDNVDDGGRDCLNVKQSQKRKEAVKGRRDVFELQGDNKSSAR